MVWVTSQILFSVSQNCEEIKDNEKFVPMNDMLLIRNARFEDAGFYTCKMTFSLDDVVSKMSETVECEVEGEDLLHNTQSLKIRSYISRSVKKNMDVYSILQIHYLLSQIGRMSFKYVCL